MANPNFLNSSSSRRLSKGHPSIVIPDKYAITPSTRPFHASNIATKRIISNFYHLNYDPTQQQASTRDRATSTDDLPQQSVSKVSGSQQEKTPPNPHHYIRLKKRLLRSLLHRIHNQNATIKSLRKEQTPAE